MLNKRTSRVGTYNINDVIFGSIFEIGDAVEATLRSKAIAIQKEGAYFTDEGFEFSQYPIFSEDIPLPDTMLTINQTRIHRDPYIDVASVRILAVSASSIIQVGNIKNIDAEARIKHIRILQEEMNNTRD